LYLIDSTAMESGPQRCLRSRPAEPLADMDYGGLISAAAFAADAEEEDGIADSWVCSSPRSVSSTSPASAAAKFVHDENGSPQVSLSASTSASSIPGRQVKAGAALLPCNFESQAESGCAEAQALAQALHDAQAALAAAKQYVSSPSLESDDLEPEAGGQCTPSPPEPELDRGIAFHEARMPPLHPRSAQLLNSLHARYGQSAAKSRVERAQSLGRAEKERKFVEAENAAKAEEAKRAKAEESRRHAEQRADSKKRAKRTARKEADERQAQEEMQRAADASVAHRYRNSAARRATSEQVRKAALMQEVMSDMETDQAKRLEDDAAKGRALQKRCEVADWSQARPRVHDPKGKCPSSPNSRRESPVNSDHGSNVQTRSAQEHGRRAQAQQRDRQSLPPPSGRGMRSASSPSLPKLVPIAPRGPRSASRERASAMVAYPAPPAAPGQFVRPPLPPVAMKRAGAAAAAMLKLPPLVRC